MTDNSNMIQAKLNKNDEFYTLYEDVEKELSHYREQLKGKIIYCSTDKPYVSEFWHYFYDNFKELGLKRLICTYYTPEDFGYKYIFELDALNNVICKKEELWGCGDFLDSDCVDLLDEVDIVVTNPPFSLFNEYITELMEHKVKFLLLGHKNKICCNNVFLALKKHEMTLGYEKPDYFKNPLGEKENLIGLCRWFTNLETNKDNKYLELKKDYNINDYKKLANFDSINVDTVSDIPDNYYDVIAVPITYMDYYNKNQFEILGRSGMPDWAYNECDFFTPPSQELIEKYKEYNPNWRVSIPYILDDNEMPIILYYRIFIRRLLSLSVTKTPLL